MTSGPDDDYERPEPNFADVMNGFSFDSGRSTKRRRWGRRRDEAADQAGAGDAVAPEQGWDGAPERGWVATPERGWEAGPPPVEWPPAGRPPAGAGRPRPAPMPVDYPLPQAPRELSPESEAEESRAASAVRPYAWTRGRTKSGFDLAIETLLSTSQRGREQMIVLGVEHRAVARLCEQARSVAEVAALLSIPLGVARVLLGDMAGLGLVTVHQTITSAGSGPDLALMERVLSGLRRL